MKIRIPSIGSLLGAFACAGGLFLSATTTQAAVVAVGVEGGAGPTYTAQNWSNPGVAKNFSVNGSNVYGSAGYYVLAPTLIDADTYEAVVAGNLNNGPTASPALQTPSVKPTFLNAEVQSLGGAWVNFPGYSIITRPDPSSVYRVGGISMATTVTGGNYGSFTDCVYFTVAPGANFRFGIMTDATGGFGARAFSIYEASSGGVTYSAALTQDGVPDLALFDINNTSGAAAQYNVALHLAAPAGGVGTFSMLTFDAIPEPSTWALLATGLCSVVFLRRRRTA
jgi:PEP-CTERM motif